MSLAPGTRLGPYEVLSPLGAGGMGEVFRARDTRLGRDVAVKVLPDHLAANPSALRRFQDEARAVAALSHPGILFLLDVGELNGVPYAVTELLEGETLRALVARGPVPPKRALEIACHLADALASAHEKGIVHRDVKPENVFLTRDGHVKLLDFGLARHSATPLASDDTHSPTVSAHTEAGVLLGTVAYMSPEQIRGLAVDHRSDQFALGVTLYEMLAGSRPFRGDTGADVVAAILTREPEPLPGADPPLPAAVRLVLERCLARDPHGRYASTRDLARDLSAGRDQASGTALADASPSSAAAILRGTRRPPQARRRLVAVLSLAALALAASVGSWIWTQRRGVETARGSATRRTPIAGAPAPSPNRVAVAVFENRTGEPALDHIGKMASGWITDGLAPLTELEVVSSALVARLAELPPPAGTPRDPEQLLAEQSGAGIVVSGSYYASGNALQFHVRVTDAQTGSVVFASGPVRAGREDPMTAVQELRVVVRDAVATRRLGRQGFGHVSVERSEPRPPRYEAFREFLVGMEEFQKDGTTARRFRTALELDPDFVTARLMLATALMNAVVQGSPEALAECRDQLRVLQGRRGELSSATRHVLDGIEFELSGKYYEALLVLREAAREEPGNPQFTHDLALNALRCNRPAEAVEALGRPLGWDFLFVPGDAFGAQYFAMLTFALHRIGGHERELKEACRSREFYAAAGLAREGRALIALGRLRDVDRLVDEGLSTVPEAQLAGALGAIARELRAHGHRAESIVLSRRVAALLRGLPGEMDDTRRRRLASALEYAEEYAEASKLLEGSTPETSTIAGVETLADLGVLAARLGDEAGARRIESRLAALTPAWLYGRQHFGRAGIRAVLGEQEQAVELLRKAASEGFWPFYGLAWPAHTWWALEGLRGYPPYEELMRPKG